MEEGWIEGLQVFVTKKRNLGKLENLMHIFSMLINHTDAQDNPPSSQCLPILMSPPEIYLQVKSAVVNTPGWGYTSDNKALALQA